MTRKLELVFLGPPASGKGTQTKILSEELKIPHVDTGGMLRESIAKGTPEGVIAKEYIDKGNLVPIDIVKKIIHERLKQSDCDNGFVLDGYPRSIEQADALNEILEDVNSNSEVKILVINIDLNQNVLIDRIVNRRLCKTCGKIYNLKFSIPKKDGICDKCSTILTQRHDDVEEVAIKRLETYTKETKPLIEYYQKKNILINIDGNGSIDEVYTAIKQILD